MKAISIRQPWAYAIAHEGKDIENRKWSCKYRGPLAIHAASRSTKKEIDAGVRAICKITDKHENHIPHGKSPMMKYGGIIAVCDLLDCVDEHSSPWFSGPYGFVLANVRPVPFYECAGQLSLFSVDVSLEQLTAPPEPKQAASKLQTVGDLIKAGRSLHFNCLHCKCNGVIDLTARSIPPGATIRGAALHLRCNKCGSPNIRTHASELSDTMGTIRNHG